VTFQFEMQNAREGFPALLDAVIRSRPQRVDGHLTYEIFGAQIELKDPIDSLPTDIGVKVDLGVAVDGLLALIGGQDDGALHGSYGSRIRYQLGEIEKLITTDPATRHAITVVADPMYDRMLPERSASVGPVLAHQFIYRDRSLNLHVFMSSCDVLNELATGMFQMAQLLAAMHNVVQSPELGTLTFHIGALYIHSGDTGIADYIKVPEVPVERDPSLPTGLTSADSWESVVERARWLRRLLSQHPLIQSNVDRLTETERWYLQTCRDL
jgi:hypothetical protein